MARMTEFLESVLAGKRLSREQAAQSMQAMVSGEVAPEQVAAFLAVLRARGETLDEVVGLAQGARAIGVTLPVPASSKWGDWVDVCGTGGDGSGTFNISTVVAFVLAGAGVGVAKHGNRSVSSRCGSADLLEHLGVRIDHEPEQAAQSIEETGFGFLFAPRFHPSFKNVQPIRRSMSVRTVFNLLGPLLNPAHVRRQLIGVYDVTLIGKMAEVLREMGTVEAMVVASDDGLDEFSLSSTTQVAHLKDGQIRFEVINPEDAGLKRADPRALAGGSVEENAKIARNVLGGALGACRDVVLLNAAAALVVAGRVPGLCEGIAMAEESIDRGRAQKALENAALFGRRPGS